MPLLTLLKIIYYFVQDDSQRRILRTLNLNASLVSQICRRLQDVCFLDLQTRPVIPFGGPGAVVKCDENKLNHKGKVNVIQYKRVHLLNCITLHLVRIARKVDDAIHWIDLYPKDSGVYFVNIYPLDRNLSGE